MLEDKLITAYIGENAEKIKNEKVNWYSAILGYFFGPVWFLYRKSYILAIETIVLIIGVPIVLTLFGAFGAHSNNILTPIFFSLTYNMRYILLVAYLVFSNKLYLMDVKRKVSKIVRKYSYLGEDKLVEIVKQKGGTNIPAAVIYVILCILCFVLFVIIFMIGLSGIAKAG